MLLLDGLLLLNNCVFLDVQDVPIQLKGLLLFLVSSAHGNRVGVDCCVYQVDLDAHGVLQVVQLLDDLLSTTIARVELFRKFFSAHHLTLEFRVLYLNSLDFIDGVAAKLLILSFECVTAQSLLLFFLFHITHFFRMLLRRAFLLSRECFPLSSNFTKHLFLFTITYLRVLTRVLHPAQPAITHYHSALAHSTSSSFSCATCCRHPSNSAPNSSRARSVSSLNSFSSRSLSSLLFLLKLHSLVLLLLQPLSLLARFLLIPLNLFVLFLVVPLQLLALFLLDPLRLLCLEQSSSFAELLALATDLFFGANLLVLEAFFRHPLFVNKLVARSLQFKCLHLALSLNGVLTSHEPESLTPAPGSPPSRSYEFGKRTPVPAWL